MLTWRVAHTPVLCLILLWTTTLMAACVDAQTISSDILNAVPPCAQTCFETYILANFDLNECATLSALQCLCRQTGRTGHTIGEGAVACIAAEASRGVCTGSDASVGTSATGYNMCVGVGNAAPRTHSTIVATLVVPTGTIPSPTPTTSTSTSTRNTRSLAQDLTSTVVPTQSVVPSNSASTTGSVDAEPTGPTDTAGATAPDEAATATQQQLSSAQIAGIVLGCLAVVALGLLLVFLARCVRKRRFGDMETGFTKMRDSVSFGGRKSTADGPPQIQISKPLQDGPFQPLQPFQWEARLPKPQQPPVQPLGVGLARVPSPSPYRKQQAAGEVAAARAAQRTAPTPPPPSMVLTPPPRTTTPKVENSPPKAAKPTLALAIPKPPKAPALTRASARDSIVTEFAEDGEDSARASGNIWRPPPTDPQSATTYFAADKGGNWVLRTKPSVSKPAQSKPTPPLPTEAKQVELPSPTDQTKAERAQNPWFSPSAAPAPLRVPSRTRNQTKLGSPILFSEPQQQQQTRPNTSSSSVYSREGMPTTVTPGPENPLPAKSLPPPDTYFAMIRDQRELTSSNSKSKRRSRRGKRTSTGSSTSIESDTAPPFEDEAIIEDEMQVDLSPVVESPISPGVSPVTYPKIRQPGQPQAPPPALALFPSPAKQPAFRVVGAPGSTPGFAVPVKNDAPAMPPVGQRGPMTAPGLPPNPRTNRNPGGMRTGSPDTRAEGYWGQPPYQMQMQPQQQQQQKQQRDPSPRPPYELSGEDVQPRWRPTQQAQQQGGFLSPQSAQQRQPSPRQPASASGGGYRGQAQGQGQPGPSMAPRPSPRPGPSGQQRPQQQQQQQQQQSGMVMGGEQTLSPGTMSPQGQWRPTPTPTPQGRPEQVMTPPMQQGSLLAKRRGADKAAALALGAKGGSGAKGWKREGIEPGPITPGIRMMTPKRNGDDLFLTMG